MHTPASRVAACSILWCATDLREGLWVDARELQQELLLLLLLELLQLEGAHRPLHGPQAAQVDAALRGGASHSGTVVAAPLACDSFCMRYVFIRLDISDALVAPPAGSATQERAHLRCQQGCRIQVGILQAGSVEVGAPARELGRAVLAPRVPHLVALVRDPVAL